MKKLLLGDEAVARGAYEAGVELIAAYPGTPSTEIAEAAAKNFSEIYCEWSPNEKVAAEVAAGASMAGARAMACMKHVGLNVAADPVFSAAYTGVNGAFVVAVADDPGMHSSQNEQDSRFYARSAHMPMLEPANSQEALDFTKLAFELSSQYDTPVFLRITTRVAHSRSLVEEGERVSVAKEYAKDASKYVLVPATARVRHVAVEARETMLSEDCNALSINTIEMKGTKLGVICAGGVYNYVQEALPEASILKLGMVYPLPKKLIEEFAAKVDELVVIEELEPFIESAIKAWGIPCSGKDRTGVQGELSVLAVKEAFGQSVPKSEQPQLPARPPVLCPGCPHRAVFKVLNKLKLVVTSDIGCYSLGALPPLSATDSVLCMGASIGMAHGISKVRPQLSKKTVAVIGDSTFFHSGITGLLDIVYNNGTATVLILDNSTTGMTGHQDHPATGKTLGGDIAPKVNLEKLCEAIGVESVHVVDPFDVKKLESVIKQEIEREAPSVIICRRECALKVARETPYIIENCRECGACLKLGCPAIEKLSGGTRINPELCNGCGLCVSYCAFDSIKRGQKEC